MMRSLNFHAKVLPDLGELVHLAETLHRVCRS